MLPLTEGLDDGEEPAPDPPPLLLELHPAARSAAAIPIETATSGRRRIVALLTVAGSRQTRSWTSRRRRRAPRARARGRRQPPGSAARRTGAGRPGSRPAPSPRRARPVSPAR